jgi:hypothetical protein
MLFSFVGRLVAPKASRKPRRRPAPPSFRPSLLTLEGREVPAGHGGGLAQLGPAQAAAPIAQIGSILPITVNNIVNQAGQLVANIGMGAANVLAPITFTTSPNPANADCPILNLHLGPIHLDVLGLNVDTSEICLAVTAEPGPGNLLGNLISGLAGILDRPGLRIGQIGQQLDRIGDTIGDLLG